MLKRRHEKQQKECMPKATKHERTEVQTKTRQTAGTTKRRLASLKVGNES